MRILFCNYEYPPLGGGGGVINALLAEELATRHEVTVLTSCGPDLPSANVENNVSVVRVPVYQRKQRAVASLTSMFSYVLQAIRVGRSLGKHTAFDIINTHFVLPSGPVGNELSRGWKIPNVLSLHGGDLYDPSKFTSPHRHLVLRIAVRYLLRRADTVVVASQNTLHNIQNYYLPDLPTAHIPLGIRRPSQTSADRADYGLSAQDTLLVTVGRLVQRKAISQLISMMSQLRTTGLKLLIIGSGPLEHALRAQSRSLNLDDAIIFLGQVNDEQKCKILRMCDLYVSTSQHEGFGIVFLEAMAAGLPIVCYDHGGHTDFLQNDVTGYVVPLNALNLFTERCRTLSAEDRLRSKIAKENYQRAESYYIDVCSARYEQIFLEAVHTDKHRINLGS